MNWTDKDIILYKNKLKESTKKLVANQIYDKIAKLFNDMRKRLGIKAGVKTVEPIRNYDIFNLDDNGYLAFTYKNVKDLGNINNDLESPSRMIKTLGVTRLRLMGFSDMTYKT